PSDTPPQPKRGRGLGPEKHPLLPKQPKKLLCFTFISLKFRLKDINGVSPLSQALRLCLFFVSSFIVAKSGLVSFLISKPTQTTPFSPFSPPSSSFLSFLPLSYAQHKPDKTVSSSIV